MYIPLFSWLKCGNIWWRYESSSVLLILIQGFIFSFYRVSQKDINEYECLFLGVLISNACFFNSNLFLYIHFIFCPAVPEHSGYWNLQAYQKRKPWGSASARGLHIVGKHFILISFDYHRYFSLLFQIRREAYFVLTFDLHETGYLSWCVLQLVILKTRCS